MKELIPLVKVVYDREEKRRWTFTPINLEDFLGLLTRDMVIQLNDRILYNIFRAVQMSAKNDKLPQGCQTQPYSRNPEKRIFQLAACIFKMVEEGTLSGWIIPSISNWYPTFSVDHNYGEVATRYILEFNKGLSIPLVIKLLQQAFAINLEVDNQKVIASLQHHFTDDVEQLID